MLINDFDELNCNVVGDDGAVVREQLDQRVSNKGAWATVLMLYRDREKDGTWQAARVLMVRLQRKGDQWKKHASATLTGEDVGVMAAWFAPGGAAQGSSST